MSPSKQCDFLLSGKITMWNRNLACCLLSHYSVVSSDLPYKEGSPQFTTVPFKPLTDHRGQRSRYISLKCSVKSRKIAVYAISIPIELTAADVTFMKKPAFDHDQLKV